MTGENIPRHSQPSSPAAASLTLLLIDDEEQIRATVGTFLSKMGYEVLTAADGEEGLRLFEEQGADIIISDIQMPDLNGIELLRRLRGQAADVEVILITGHGDVETAVEALREGAFDFFSKPVQLHELTASLERTRRYQAVRREKERIQERLESMQRSGRLQLQEDDVVGESDAMAEVMSLVGKVAGTERTTVLITGESGTGKELIARAIHKGSPRADEPFIGINCTAIPDSLFESELFGHEEGAFTDARSLKKGLFELSSGGTLFLDEIADMSAPSQAKLLRVLEERSIRRVGGVREIPVDVRFLAATNQDLQKLQEEGRFRQDLYYRLKVFTVELPPLRQRGDDVLILAYHFLSHFAREFRKDVRAIDADVQELLRRYAFPGNVRELRNLIERAVILCDGSSLSAFEFADLGRAARSDSGAGEPTLDLAELENRAIRDAMERTGGNQVQAARLLGVGVDALRYRLKKQSSS